QRPPNEPVPLWFARLDEPANASTLRAVWSPDFRPGALLDGKVSHAPPRGPWAPWAMPRGVSASDPYVGDEKPELFRTSLDAYDRRELVILSSVHGLPVRGRVDDKGRLAPESSQIDPPPGFRLADATIEALTQGSAKRDWSTIYKPK